MYFCGDSVVKHFNVIMAGLISGIVALFTSWLGVSGTVIGSVFSSFLYQFLSSYSAEKYEERVGEGHSRKPRNIGSEIVYIFPIVVIVIIEVIFILSDMHYVFDKIFDILEYGIFQNNLFRLMGLGLIALGVYPLLSSTNIEKINGEIVLVAGIYLFIRGMVDINDLTMQVHNIFFADFDFIIAIIVVLALVFVIFNVLRNSTQEYFNKEDEDYDAVNEEFTQKRFSKPKRKSGARKIDTSSFHNGQEYNEHYLNSDFKDNQSPNHDFNMDDYHNEDLNNYQAPQENLPVYEEEIIYLHNPEDPNNPIKKRLLKRVNPDSHYVDDYDETYIIDDGKNDNF